MEHPIHHPLGTLLVLGILLGSAGAGAGDGGEASPEERSSQGRFERALSHLMRGDDGREGQLGPYRFFTDVRDDDLLEQLARVAGHVDRAYGERYGLELAPRGSEAVVLFARDDDYLDFLGVDPESSGVFTGHTAGGVAILSAGERGKSEVKTLLVHELVHLVNRRAFGSRAVPWIEEGSCDDLAFCKVSDDGSLQLGTLGGVSELSARPGGLPGGYLISRSFTGGLAGLKHLLDMYARRELVPLPELTSMGWGDFLPPPGRPLRYAQSTFFLRFLLDWRGGRRAEAAQAFLADFAAGGEGDGEALMRHLDDGWEKVERDFDRYLRRQARLPR